jgi:nucleoside 2-deoxyribosyltransferase
MGYNAAGYLCERADLSVFTGDVMEWVKKRIASSSLIIADLSNANPNVYLEVGYAWGCGKPTVLLVRDPAELKFDVKGQRCLVYKKIKDLEESLRKELETLQQHQLG